MPNEQQPQAEVVPTASQHEIVPEGGQLDPASTPVAEPGQEGAQPAVENGETNVVADNVTINEGGGAPAAEGGSSES